jgi:hypothetical protein
MDSSIMLFPHVVKETIPVVFMYFFILSKLESWNDLPYNARGLLGSSGPLKILRFLRDSWRLLFMRM